MVINGLIRCCEFVDSTFKDLRFKERVGYFQMIIRLNPTKYLYRYILYPKFLLYSNSYCRAHDP